MLLRIINKNYINYETNESLLYLWKCNKEKIYLGSFSSKEDAIKARLNGELKLFGKYKSKILNNEIN